MATVAPPVQANLSRADLIEDYDRDRLGFVLRAVRRFGPVVELSPGTVLFADGEVAHDVLRRTNRDFLMDRDRAWRPTDSRRGEDALESLMSARRAMLSALSGDLVAEHLRWYSASLTALLDTWAGQGRTDDPLRPLVRLSTDAFLRLCTGPSGQPDERAGLATAVAGLLDALNPIVRSSYELPWFLDRLTRRRRRAARAQQRLEAGLGALDLADPPGHPRRIGQRSVAVPGARGADDLPVRDPPRRTPLPGPDRVPARALARRAPAGRRLPAVRRRPALVRRDPPGQGAARRGRPRVPALPPGGRLRTCDDRRELHPVPPRPRTPRPPCRMTRKENTAR